MIDRLAVWIYPPDQHEPARCGTLTLVGGRVHLFEYDRTWLSRKDAFVLSPDLPLHWGVIESGMGRAIHPIFEDAGPDKWGRSVIDKVFNLSRVAEMDYLACAGEDRIGAMGFSWDEARYVAINERPFEARDIEDLMRAARAMQNREPIDERMKRLLRPGTSAGGARPKAVIRDEGRSWIAKFPAEGDAVDVCAIEHASLQLARLSGISVPITKLVEVTLGKHAVLVERFDRAPNETRRHFASARTMLLAQGIRPDGAAYSDIAATARRFSLNPRDDAHEVFRRMVFNILMENTDDHDKNHGFLMMDGGWCLAPAYDMQPQLHGLGVQQLRVGNLGYESSLENAVSDCGRFMLSEPDAREIVEKMLAILESWPQVYREHGVSELDIEHCQRFVRVTSEGALWSRGRRRVRS